MKLIQYISIAITLLLTSGLISSCKDKGQGDEQIQGNQIGQYLLEFNLENEKGDIVSLSDFKGKLVLIEFWASWCGYCNTEAPKLNVLYNDFKDQNFEIIGISIDQSKAAWLSKVKNHKIKYTQVNDPLGFDAPVVSEYGVQSIPKMILVNREGQILYISNKTDQVREVLQQKLK